MRRRVIRGLLLAGLLLATPARADPADAVRRLYADFVAAQNAHDFAALRATPPWLALEPAAAAALALATAPTLVPTGVVAPTIVLDVLSTTMKRAFVMFAHCLVELRAACLVQLVEPDDEHWIK